MRNAFVKGSSALHHLTQFVLIFCISISCLACACVLAYSMTMEIESWYSMHFQELVSVRVYSTSLHSNEPYIVGEL